MSMFLYKRFASCFAAVFLLSCGLFVNAQEPSKNEAELEYKSKTPVTIESLNSLPVMHQGRYKAFDSIARQTLLTLSGKSTIKDDEGKKYTASEWLAASIFVPRQAVAFKIFLLEDPEVADAIGMKSEMKRVRYSYNDISPHFDQFEKLANQAIATPAAARSRFQRHLLQFYERVFKFIDLQKEIWPEVDNKMAWFEIATSYIVKDQEKFDTAIEGYTKKALNNELNAKQPATEEDFANAKQETLFNRIDPFYNSGIMLAFALLFALCGLVFVKKVNFAFSLLLCVAALILQTYGHGVRMIVMGRPPVTNLYSTFICVAWICSVLSLAIMWFIPRGFRIISPLVAAFSSLVFLVIAGKYANSGDAMGVMVAVLDSNFWLATHVVTIIIGYAGCCAAGFWAHIYMITRCTCDKAHVLNRSFYSLTLGLLAVGFAMTFIGTVLGGVWADQSWGRFWGWDPKENGALLIVLWCAVVFHVKVGNLLSRFWIAAGTIISIFIVLLAWFGVNKLGVGLHSYGNDPDSNFFVYMIAYLIFEFIFVGVTYVLMRQKQK